jgi:hypothetical protein
VISLPRISFAEYATESRHAESSRMVQRGSKMSSPKRSTFRRRDPFARSIAMWERPLDNPPVPPLDRHRWSVTLPQLPRSVSRSDRRAGRRRQPRRAPQHPPLPQNGRGTSGEDSSADALPRAQRPPRRRTGRPAHRRAPRFPPGLGGQGADSPLHPRRLPVILRAAQSAGPGPAGARSERADGPGPLPSAAPLPLAGAF